MTSRIKNVSELPKWFHLDKYKAAKKLNAAGWYEQLRLRVNFLVYLDPTQDEVPAEIRELPIFKDALAEALAVFRETPIFDIKGEGRGKLPIFLYFDDPSRLCKKFDYALGVHQMTLEEFELVRSAIDPIRLQYVACWKDQFQYHMLDTSKPFYKLPPWIREPVCKSIIVEIKDEHDFGPVNLDTVVVDLNFPDKILIENFKQYLASRREESKTEHLSKPNRQQDFYDWTRFGVLPYLDLKLWEMETGNKIPLRVLADAIYPLGEGGEETVRKTTAPLANSLIQEHNLRILITQVAIELVTEKEAVS